MVTIFSSCSQNRQQATRRIPGNERLNSVDCLLPFFDAQSVKDVAKAMTRCEPPWRARRQSTSYTRVPPLMTTPCEPTDSFSVANAERRAIRTSRSRGDENTTKNQMLKPLDRRGAVKRPGETGNIETRDPALLGSAG